MVLVGRSVGSKTREKLQLPRRLQKCPRHYLASTGCWSCLVEICYLFFHGTSSTFPSALSSIVEGRFKKKTKSGIHSMFPDIVGYDWDWANQEGRIRIHPVMSGIR